MTVCGKNALAPAMISCAKKYSPRGHHLHALWFRLIFMYETLAGIDSTQFGKPTERVTRDAAAFHARRNLLFFAAYGTSRRW